MSANQGFDSPRPTNAYAGRAQSLMQTVHVPANQVSFALQTEPVFAALVPDFPCPDRAFVEPVLSCKLMIPAGVNQVPCHHLTAGLVDVRKGSGFH